LIGRSSFSALHVPGRRSCTELYRCTPEVWHLGGESHSILEGPFHPARTGYDSNRVDAAAASPQLLEELREAFYARSMNFRAVGIDGARLLSDRTLAERVMSKALICAVRRRSARHRRPRIRFLEKTPRNTLRVSLLDALFPDARFVFLHRDPGGNIDSLIEGWRATDRMLGFKRERFARASYPLMDELRVPDFHGDRLKFVLQPGWRSLAGHPLADIAAAQYLSCNEIALADLAAIPSSRQLVLGYNEFVRAPAKAVERILDWADLAPSHAIASFVAALPRVNTTRARGESGIRNAAAVQAAVDRLHGLADLGRRLGYG